jgi:uncharacterized protein (TIGR02285 family)
MIYRSKPLVCLFFIILLSAISCNKPKSDEIPIVATQETDTNKETIIWYKMDFPPVFIFNGAYKDQGFLDLTQDLLIKSLPQYNHIERQANMSRIQNEIKNNDNVVCIALLKNTEREQYIKFSEDYFVGFVNRIFIKRDYSSQIEDFLLDDDTVDLELLLSSDSFKLGISSGRSYGIVIDDIISRYRNSYIVYERMGSDQIYGLNELLLSENRDLDGIIAYPQEINFSLKEKNYDFNEFVSYHIAGSPQYFLGNIGISKSAFGEKLSQEINLILDQIGKKQIAGFYQSWLSADDILIHKKLVEDVFSEN